MCYFFTREQCTQKLKRKKEKPFWNIDIIMFESKNCAHTLFRIFSNNNVWLTVFQGKDKNET